MKDKITIKGAREHNLQNIDLEIPRNKMVVFTGVSGSGKTSLAFDTIFAEGQRRYVESLSAYARQFLGQMQKPDVDEIEGLSPAISIDQKAHSANPRSTVATITEIYDYLRVLYARIGTPHCVKCNKPIEKMSVDEIVDIVLTHSKKAKDRNEMIEIFSPVVKGRKGEYYQLLYDYYNRGFSKVRVDGKIKNLSNKIVLSRYKRHDIDILIDAISAGGLTNPNKSMRNRLADAVEVALEHGENVVRIKFGSKKKELTISSQYSCPDCGFSFPEIEPRLFSFNSPYGACQECTGLGTRELFSEHDCPACRGARLRPESLAVLIGKKNIVDVTAMSIDQAVEFFVNLKLSKRQKEISNNIMREIMNRLQFMYDVGLHYLTLDRKAGTLSGGEAQRIRLASQIGTRLVGALYVLDEPTIGLHQRDNDLLLKTLKDLRDLGNTIVVVEHDQDTILAADHMVEFGPGAGVHGGEIVCSGPVPKILDDKNSLTGAYIGGRKEIPIPKRRRVSGKVAIKIRGAKQNNLRGINVDLPLRRFVCVTGVSGSGKSSLIYDVMYKTLAKKLHHSKNKPGDHKEILGTDRIDKIVLVNQSPIGRTPRSNPATYTGTWTPIREMFAMTEEARYRGYKPGRFSFNRPGGRCEHCEGNGRIAIEMHFLPTVYVTCDVCAGTRFDRETLEVKYKGKNIHDVLEMTIEESVEFFKDIPPAHDRLKTLDDVGLGYLKIGQSAPTLSGGEAQRVKLAAELSKRQTGRTLYLLDEPTTGLHFEDIKKLLEVLHMLVDKGNTVVVIEHNLDIIKTADWLIDLGPEGGDKGGQLVGVGTPEDIVANKKSWTGKYLKDYL